MRRQARYRSRQCVYHLAMRSPTCLLESRVYSLKNLRSTVQKDFYNTICTIGDIRSAITRKGGATLLQLFPAVSRIARRTRGAASRARCVPESAPRSAGAGNRLAADNSWSSNALALALHRAAEATRPKSTARRTE